MPSSFESMKEEHSLLYDVNALQKGLVPIYNLRVAFMYLSLINFAD